MNSRERVMTALNHKEPDSIPIDLGGYQDTTMTLTTYRELERYYGRKFDNYNLFSWMDGLLYPDDELLKVLNVDTRSIFTGKGKHAELKSFYREIGVKTLEDGGLGVYSDDGELLLFKKPKDAYGFQFLQYPLAGELTTGRIDEYFKNPQTDHHLFFGINRPKSVTNKRNTPIPAFDPRLAAKIPQVFDQTEMNRLTEKVKWLHENTDYAIITGNCVGLVVTSMQFVMGFEDWFVNLALSPKELMYATETYLENHLLPFLDNFYREIGPYIDVAYCVADDMATQRGPSFSLDQFRQYFKPMHKKMIETVKKHTQAKIMFHICGAAYPYLADLIEIGVDIINPVQNKADGMEAEKIKRDFGKDLSFWGAIDTQQILTNGTREQVIDEVKRKIEILGKDGGYIFSPCHDIQRGTPLENIIAMYETANSYINVNREGEKMTRRERVIQALNHKDTDIIPYQLMLTTQEHDKIAEYLKDPGFFEKSGSHLDMAIFGGPFGPETERPGFFKDDFGVVWDKTGVDRDIGMMDELLIKQPDIRTYKFPEVVEGEVHKQFQKLVNNGKDTFKIGRIAMAMFERAWSLRGIENLLVDMIEEPDFVDDLLDAICEYDMKIVDIGLQYDIDGFYFGDDWGQQQPGLMMGPAKWRRFIKPRMARLYEKIRSKGKFAIQHCCGDILEIYPELIEIGLNVHQTFQPEIYPIEKVKKEFGNDLTFWGGISTQRLLPYATPEVVKNETIRIMKILGNGGGYIASPTHYCPGDVPVENIMAMLDVFRNQDKYFK